MASTATARSRRAPHLRVVRPGEAATRPAARATARPDATIAVLLLSTLALVLVGLVMVLSASSVEAYTRYGSSFLFFRRQLVFAFVGTLGMIVVARMSYQAWERLCVPLLLLVTALLVLVLHPAAGTVAGGSARWLELGPITVQPSEFAKLAVITFGAALLARRWDRLHDLRLLVLPLVPIVAVLGLLVMLQPDLGTAVIIVACVFVLLFVAGARMKHLLIGGLGTAVLGLGLIRLEGYRWTRFVSFLDPWADPQGSGYQVIQSLIGLTSGGPLGLGLGAGRQKWLYVPNAHTDFIFSIIGEELGLLGMLVVLALFGALVWAGTRIAMRAPDAFGRLLAAGITGWIGVQALVNFGAVTGMLPITGVPLPLVSFGGSSLVACMVAVGMLVSIGRRSARRW